MRDRIEKLLLALGLLALLAVVLLLAPDLGGASEADYVLALFDRSRVHEIDLAIEDFAAFLAAAPQEAYIPCRVTIDGRRMENVGLRAKGNNSLRLTEEYGLARYSLKLEFDHYVPGGNYLGLDKLSLDASFQDNSYLKTYMALDMMDFLGVPSPLCSFAFVTVNGVDFGLYLALEEPEESFARREFGARHGQLYKPDYRRLADENADLALRDCGSDPANYPAIFENALLPYREADARRLVRAIQALSGPDPGAAVDVETVLRYFAVQSFVMNWDSYIGPTGHNYLLYEKNGKLAMLPWDYNLAFGTYALGMSEPIREAETLINYPVFTPWEGEVMRNRPLYHNLMLQDEIFARYREVLDEFLRTYMESGRFAAVLTEVSARIAPYVERDPTAFCSAADHALAVETLGEICRLRAESLRGQLDGRYPATLAAREAAPGAGVDCAHVRIEDLGDFDDLRSARKSQWDAARACQ